MRHPHAYIVTRTDTHSGGSVRAHSVEDAARRALRSRWMAGAVEVKVVPISPAGGTRAVIRVRP